MIPSHTLASWNFVTELISRCDIFKNARSVYISLKNSDLFQPIALKSRLKCYIERKAHPYFILNPVKTEQLSEYPYIIQMYDVLGDETMQELQRLRGSMQVSPVVTATHDLMRTIQKRSSVGFLIRQNLTDKVNKKSEMLSGLHISAKYDEGLQLIEYTYGRLYSHH